MSTEPIVRALQIDWTFDDLTPDELDRLPAEVDGDSVDRSGEQVFYAERHHDQAMAWLLKRLAVVPRSLVIITLVEIPLEEWIGTYGGDADDLPRQAEVQR